MNYTKKELGEDLKKELRIGYNIERISNWAFNLLYIKERGQHHPDVKNILEDISLMSAGPEFEYTEEELKLLAEILIKEGSNPIK